MTDTGMVKLAPCPFCKSADVEMASTGVCWAHCPDCSAEGPIADSEAEATERWNQALRSTASGDGEALRIAREELATAEREGLCEGCTVAARQIVKRLAALHQATEE